MRRVAASVLGLAALAAATSGVATSPAAPGDGIATVGWWSSNPLATARPDGGFEVVADPSGVQAYAAVELDDVGAVSSASLRLSVDSTVGTVALRLCPVFVAFEADNPGGLGDGPDHDCTVAVAVTETGPGDAFVADITRAVQAGGPVRYAVVPSPSSFAFRAVFSGAEVRTVAAPATPTSEAPPPPAGSAGSSGDGFDDDAVVDPPAAGAFTAAVGGDPFADFVAGVGAEPGPSSVPEPGVAAGAAPLVDPGPGTSFVTTALPGTDAEQRPWGRLVLLVPLSAAIGVGAARARSVLEARGLVAS